MMLGEQSYTKSVVDKAISINQLQITGQRFN